MTSVNAYADSAHEAVFKMNAHGFVGSRLGVSGWFIRNGVRDRVVTAAMDNWPGSYGQCKFWGKGKTVQRILASKDFQREAK